MGGRRSGGALPYRSARMFSRRVEQVSPPAFNLATHFRDGLQGQLLFTCLAPVWRPNLNMHWLLSVVARPCQKLQVNFGTAGRWFRTANGCERLLAIRNGAEPGTSESCLGPCVLGSVSRPHSRREFTQRNPSEVNRGDGLGSVAFRYAQSGQTLCGRVAAVRNSTLLLCLAALICVELRCIILYTLAGA
jgi:hypothetical protein